MSKEDLIPGTNLPNIMPNNVKKFWRGAKPTKVQFCDKIEFWNYIYEKYDFDASIADRNTIWEYWGESFK